MSSHWNTERYNKSKDVRIFTIKQLFKWSNFNIAPNSFVLDLGCGNGLIDTYLCQQYPTIQLLGVDIDSSMIAGQDTADLKNLSFSKKDARCLDYKEKFELIISTATLHWIQEQDIVLKGVYNALKVNGDALFIIYPKQPYVWEALDILCAESEWNPYFNEFDAEYYSYDVKQYRQLANNCKLNVVKIELMKDFYRLNEEGVKNMLSSYLPHLKVLPESMHFEFMGDLCHIIFSLMQKDGIYKFEDYYGLSLNVHLNKVE